MDKLDESFRNAIVEEALAAEREAKRANPGNRSAVNAAIRHAVGSDAKRSLPAANDPHRYKPTIPTGQSIGAPAAADEPKPDAIAFPGKLPFDEGHPKALAIYCSDGRFTKPIEELLAQKGYDRHDTLTLPGGPGLFESWTGSFSATDAVRRGSSFLVASHGIEHVVLIAHENCGYYGTRYGAYDSQRMREQQASDIRTAAKMISLANPGVHIEAYFARTDKGVVLFEEIPIAKEVGRL